MATSPPFVVGGKRRRNPNVAAIKKFQENISKVGKVLGTDLNFYVYVAGLGDDKVIKPKDPTKTFTFHKQELYVIVGSLQGIDLNNRLVTEIEYPKKSLRLEGIWDNNASKSFIMDKQNNPSFVLPKTTKCLYLEEGKMYKLGGKYRYAVPGDILKLIGVRVSCGRNTRVEAIEKYGFDSGWPQFNSHVRGRHLTIDDQLSMFDHAGLYTTYVEPYVLGHRPSFDHAMTSFVFALGPTTSCFEDPVSKHFFQLDINYSSMKYEVPAGKEEKEIAAAAVGLSADDPEAPKVYQMGLGLNVAGIQGRTDDPDSEQTFLLDIMMFPWDKVCFEEKAVRPGPLFNFGIVSRGIWKSVMPRYIHMMELVLIGSVNWKRTEAYAGQMDASEGGVQTYVADIGDTGDNWRLGGAKQGVSAEDTKKKLDKFGFDDDDDDDKPDNRISEKGKEAATMELLGDAPGDSVSGILAEKDLDMPNFDFAYNIQTKNIVFNAKAFWKHHAVHVSPETAEALYNWYLRFEEKVHKGENGNLPFVKMSEEHANEIFRRTDIISASCLFLGSERLVDIDDDTGQSPIKGIQGYYVAVPWRNLHTEYLPHLKAMSMAEGDALVGHLYNWPVFVSKRKIPSLDDPRMRHAKALYELEGGTPFFTEKAIAHQYAPAIFVAWNADASIDTDEYKEERDKLVHNMIGGSVLVAPEKITCLTEASLTLDPQAFNSKTVVMEEAGDLCLGKDLPTSSDPVPKAVDTPMRKPEEQGASQSSSSEEVNEEEEEEEKPKKKKRRKRKKKKKKHVDEQEIESIESLSSEDG